MTWLAPGLVLLAMIRIGSNVLQAAEPAAEPAAPGKEPGKEPVERALDPGRSEAVGQTTLHSSKYVWGEAAENAYWFSADRDPASGEVFWYLFFKSVRSAETGWAYWETAADQDGQEFKVRTAAREVLGGGKLEEIVLIRIHRDYYESRRATGARIRVDGKTASQVINILPAAIDSFRKRVDEAWPPTVKPASTTPPGPSPGGTPPVSTGPSPTATPTPPSKSAASGSASGKAGTANGPPGSRPEVRPVEPVAGTAADGPSMAMLGASIPVSRPENLQARRKRLSPLVTLGMSQEEVRAAMGKPDRSFASVSTTSDRDIWYYRSGERIVFNQGRVEEIRIDDGGMFRVVEKSRMGRDPVERPFASPLAHLRRGSEDPGVRAVHARLFEERHKADAESAWVKIYAEEIRSGVYDLETAEGELQRARLWEAERVKAAELRAARLSDPKLNPTLLRAIEGREIVAGMSTDDLIASVGLPISRQANAGPEKAERWVIPAYREHRDAWVFIRNGRVDSWAFE